MSKLKSCRWTREDALIQLDALQCGLRAGLGPTVLRLLEDGSSERRPVIEVLGPKGAEHDLLVGVAVSLGIRVSKGDGDGNGNGDGDGNGNGDGDGYGDGYGYGDGSGYGDGNRYGFGNRYGDGNGNGYGDGNGNGDGNGYGSGSGHRSYGNGPGLDNGYGYGYGYGCGESTGFGTGDPPIYYVEELMTNIDQSKPILIRHHYAGVYLGYYQGPGLIPGTHRIWCRHIWRWSERLGTTALAHVGPTPEASVGPWVSAHLPEAELIGAFEATVEAMEALEKVPVSLEKAR